MLQSAIATAEYGRHLHWLTLKTMFHGLCPKSDWMDYKSIEHDNL